MIQITDKKKCTGCTACMVSCPTQAISMSIDEEGFQYPIVNSNKCINCEICNNICPNDKSLEEPSIRITYAVKHKNPRVLKESTSGGFFTAISDYILKQGGVVYGAVLDEKIAVRHIRATTIENRDKMRGSKYVQSDLGEIFKQVKQDLIEDRKVLFTGTPCQIAGLRNYLRKDYEGLISLDLICHGVPSPLIYKEHVLFLSKKLKTKIIDYKFRPKLWGWHIHREIVFGEKKIYHSSPYTDLWRNLYYSRIIIRPSCNSCIYSNLNRVGDITIGDCRGIDKVDSNFGSYEGVTLAIINTLKGKKVFDKVADSIIYEPINIEKVMQPPLKLSGNLNKSSAVFFKNYSEYGYKKAIMNYYGKLYPLKYYIKKIIKGFVNKNV